MAFRLELVTDVASVIRGNKDVEGSLDAVADALDDVASGASDTGRSLSRSLDDASSAADDLADAGREAGRDVERSLDSAADAADDVGKAGRNAGDDLADGIQDGTKDAGAAVDDMADSFGDRMRAMHEQAAEVGDGLGSGVEDGAARVSEGTEQMRDDAASNATEMAASFDGSVGSMTDAAQGFIAEGLAGFGPAGAAAGLAAGIGLGILTSKMEEAKEAAAEAASEVADLAGEMIDLGSTRLGPDQVQQALADAASEAEDGENKLQEWADAAAAAGVAFGDYAAGMAGDADAATRSLAEIDAALAAERKTLEEMPSKIADLTGARNDENHAIEQQTQAAENHIDALQETRDSLAETSGVVDEASDIYGLYSEALESSTAASEQAAQAAQDEADAQEELRAATVDVAAAIRDAASARIAASDSEIGYMQTVADTTEAIAKNGATLDLNQEAGRNNQAALNSLASSTLSLAEANRVNGAATDESNAKLTQGRAAFIAAAVAAGQTEQAAAELATQYGLIPEVVDTAAQVTGVAEAEAELAKVTASRTVAVTPRTDSLAWQQAVDRAASSLRPPMVTVNPRLGQVAV